MSRWVDKLFLSDAILLRRGMKGGWRVGVYEMHIMSMVPGLRVGKFFLFLIIAFICR
jgi:hypothetical protein